MEPSAKFNIPDSDLKVTHQAGRPVFDDFLQINLFSEGEYQPLLTFALQKAAELERVLNLDDPQSEICRLLSMEGDDSFELSYAVGEVMEKALDMSVLSDGVFEPFREDSKNWDLRSLIRGYIVDETVKALTSQEHYLMGMVHLAESSRFFNCPKKSVHVRMGNNEREKEIGLFKDAIATTEARGSLYDPDSATLYLQPLRQGIGHHHTVSVIADDCATANVLTKVGLYAPMEIIHECVHELGAQIVVFNEIGEVAELYDDATAYSSDHKRTSYYSYDDSNRD